MCRKKTKKSKHIKKTKSIIGLDEKNSPIEFIDLSFIYNKKTPYELTALKNINLEIKPKIITAIIGSTGSGKSTLIQHINGLLLPTSGKIKINNFEINSKMKKIPNVKSLRKTIGLVFQFPEYQLFERTVLDDIIFGAINMGADHKDAIEIGKKYLNIVGLENDYLYKSPFNLSGGQKRRVAIAGILALEGNTLVLDEPTAGLDPQGEDDFIALFKKLNDTEQKRIIIITHNMDDVLKVADEVIVMDQGKIVYVGNPFELFQNTQLVHKYNIKLPKLYVLINHLSESGFDLNDQKIRTIDQLTTIVTKQLKTGGD